jgi:predicted ATPase
MVAHLISQGVIVSRNGLWTWQGQGDQFHWSIPDTLRHVIEGQLDRLSQEEQRLLDVGSVAGMEFSASIIAAALGEGLIPVEECCETLARHHLFLHVAGTQTEQERRLATRYRFSHSFYLNVIYERLPQAKRRQLHQCMGVYKEREYGKRTIEIASELATHFKEGREYPRAVHYLGLAAQTAMERHAPHEALIHLHQAQALLATLPGSPKLRKQLREVQRALQHPLLSLANTEARSIRYPGLSQSQFRKIA